MPCFLIDSCRHQRCQEDFVDSLNSSSPVEGLTQLLKAVQNWRWLSLPNFVQTRVVKRLGLFGEGGGAAVRLLRCIQARRCVNAGGRRGAPPSRAGGGGAAGASSRKGSSSIPLPAETVQYGVSACTGVVSLQIICEGTQE